MFVPYLIRLSIVILTFCTYISFKQRPSPSDKSNGFKWKHRSRKASNRLHDRAAVLGVPIEDVAATRIQTAFRAFMVSIFCLKKTSVEIRYLI